MPARTTLHRLGAVTTLYAVFPAGWWLGQPMRSDGCLEDRHAAASDRPAPVEPADPGRHLGNLGLGIGLLDWADDLDGRRDGEYGPGDYGYEPRHGAGAYTTSGSDDRFCSYRSAPA